MIFETYCTSISTLSVPLTEFKNLLSLSRLSTVQGMPILIKIVLFIETMLFDDVICP